MLRIDKTVGVLAVIGILVGLSLFINSQSADPDNPSSNALPQTKSEPTTEVQPASTGQDPFKKFLDEKSNNPNSSVKSENAQSIPVQPGKDPFKEFLEKQKQTSKDQVVSPFGKN
jgi:type III secretory pathway component EscR